MTTRPPCLCTGRDDIRCDSLHCDLASPHGAPGDTERCVPCWQWLHSADHNRAWGGSGRVRSPASWRMPLPCVHLGLATGETRPCKTCTGRVDVPLRACASHGACTETKLIAGVSCCRICPDAKPIAPVADVKIDLAGVLPGRSFNGSIAEFEGKTWLAQRRYWDRARVALVELDPLTWQPRGAARELALGQLAEDAAAQEDPRLFVHRERLHLSYTACSWRGRELDVSVCVARLGADMQVEESWHPHFAGRQTWEKNWAFFSPDGDLYAVHTIQPHRVLMMTGPGCVERALEDARLDAGPYGALRGGAPPVLYAGEYYHFFHGRREPPAKGLYSVGLYTFSPAWPFRPLRFARTPLFWPDSARKPGAHVADVVFPCGAIYRDGCWHVSYGHHDSETRVASWNAADLERLLEPVAGGERTRAG